MSARPESMLCSKRKFALNALIRSVLPQVPGDVIECGVFRGGSASILLQAVEELAPDRTVHLYDTFTGLSGVGKHDAVRLKAGTLSCPLDIVRSNLAEYSGRVLFYPGAIDDQTPFPEEFSFAHLDLDLYEPTAAALRKLVPQLRVGAIIVVDDYSENFPGVKRAVDEVLTPTSLLLSTVIPGTPDSAILIWAMP